MYSADGALRHHVPGKGGSPLGAATGLRDMTRLGAAEGELIYHAHLLENMEEAVLATDRDFVVTAWNQGAERMFGWTAGDALGRVAFDLVPTSFDAVDLAKRRSTPRTVRRCTPKP
jgi:PAS domain-containing protein